MQQQVSEINNRFELIGAKLSDRQSELDAMKEEVKRHLDSLRTLNNFLDKVGSPGIPYKSLIIHYVC